MIRIVNNVNDLQSLTEQWNELADLQQNVLLRYEWIVTAARCFFPNDEIRFFVYSEEGRVNAIAPLVKIGRGHKAKLFLIGFPYLYEPADFLYRDQGSLKTLMRAIAQQNIPVVFHRIPANSPIFGFDFWGATSGRLSRARITHQSSTQFLDITTNWNEFYSALTSKNRNDLRRAKRKAELVGDVSFEVSHVDQESNVEFFKEFLALEQKSWKQKARTAISSTQGLNTFFGTFTSLGSASEGLYYAHMRIGEQEIAAQLFRIRYDKLWILKIAHDEEYKFCSPGTLLMEEVIRFAFEQGFKGVEFLGFSERWLKKWTSGLRMQVDFSYYPLSLRSAGNLLAGAKTRILKKLKLK
jgi:CelD/BcsL family acetyltransferase involved in cellulose biosynthesis